jgi:uncharacterized membrane protein (UPF0182 family)
LLFRNSTDFGVKDAQFNLDISFFAFKLPLYQALISWAISALVLAAIASVFVHYMYGGIRTQGEGDRTTVAARVQLSILFGLIVLIKAVAYWFDRYALALKENRLFTGATYTDINATLPAKAILTGIAVVCALLFFANIVRKSWLLPAAGTALMVVSSVLIAGIYPGAVQQFQVKPSESSKEAPYIQRNIDATRAAYGLTDVEVQEYNALVSPNAGQLAGDAATISNIRLMDPAVLSATFRQLQQIKPYYGFTETLDIDRYTVNSTSMATQAVTGLTITSFTPTVSDLSPHTATQLMLMESQTLLLAIYHQLRVSVISSHESTSVKTHLNIRSLVVQRPASQSNSTTQMIHLQAVRRTLHIQEPVVFL